jgi:hypothetical protein
MKDPVGAFPAFSKVTKKKKKQRHRVPRTSIIRANDRLQLAG